MLFMFSFIEKMLDFSNMFKTEGPDVVYTWTIPVFAAIIFRKWPTVILIKRKYMRQKT